MFVVHAANGTPKISEHALTTAFDINTASQSTTYNISSHLTEPRGIRFNNDGTKLYISSGANANKKIYEFSLSTAYDVSSLPTATETSISGQDSGPRGFSFNADGTKMFLIGDTNNAVYEYSLSTAFDTTTISYTNRSLDISAKEVTPRGLSFNPTGTKLYITGQNSDDILEYDLSTGFNLSTATFNGAFSLTGFATKPNDVVFNNDGTKAFIARANNNGVLSFSLSSPYSFVDITGEHSGDVIDTSNTNTYDTDPDSDTLTVTAIRTGDTEGAGTAGSVGSALTGSYGDLTIASDGSYTYVANNNTTDALDAGDIVTDTFNYTVSDGQGETDIATITITITGINDAPTAVADTDTVNANSTVTDTTNSAGTLVSDDTDPDASASLYVTKITHTNGNSSEVTYNSTKTSNAATITGSKGTLTFGSDGSYSYAANSDATSGDDVFTYTLTDGTSTTTSTLTITINNNAPTVVNDTDSVTEGGTVTETTNSAGTVISDDSDTDGDSLSVSGTVTQTSATDTSGSSITINSPNSASVGSAVTGYYGQLTLNSNGTYSYVANQSNADALDSGESATDVFTFTVSDGTTTTSSTITFTVNGANDAPTASDNTVTTTEDNNHTFAASEFGFTDVDGDSLDHVTIATLPSTGTLYLSGVAVSAGDQISAANISNLVFTPAANGNGSPYDTFTFSVNDGTTDSASNYTMTVNVTAVNDAPTASDNTVTTTEDNNHTFAASEFGFTDVDGDSLDHVTIATLPSTGTLYLSGVAVSAGDQISAANISNLVFTPAANGNGSPYDTFTFSVNDGTTDSASNYTMTVNVTAVNDAPTASDNTVTTTEDNNHTFAASEFGFTDVDGDSLDHVTIATLPSTGTLYLSGVAVSAGDQISAANISNLVFTPAANGNGSPYDTFTFSVNDGTTDSASNYTMTVNVTAVNDAPTASDNTVTTTEDNNHTFAASEFGFTDVDGDSLDHVTIATLPSTGTLYLSGVAVSAGDQISAANISNLVFTPAANGNGSPYDTFTFSVNDGTTDSASNYTMTVNVTAVNDAPTVVNDTDSVTEGGTVTETTNSAGTVISDDSDTDGDSLSVSGTVTQTSATDTSGSSITINSPNSASVGSAVTGYYGQLTLNSNGTYSYVANQSNADALDSGESATDVFTFTVSDGTTTTSSTITFTVNGANDAPTASDNTVTTTEDNNHTFAASEFGFTDVDGDSLDHVTIATLPSTGTLYLSGVAVSAGDQISAANISNLVFTPAANGNGSPYDTFTFSVNDGTTDSASNYTMTVNVTAVNDAPTASDNTVTTTEDNNHTFAASEFGFTDVDGDSLDHVTIATLPSTGTLYLSGVAVSAGDQISAANISNLVFTPAANGNGSPYDTFTFSVNDGTTDSASNYTMTVNVTAVNDAPTASDNTVTTTEDNNHTFAASEFGFTDVDGDSLDHVTIATLPSTGTLYLSGVAVSAGDQISAANISNLVFTPAANGNGSPYDTFTFSVNDGTTDSASNYTMTVNVTAVNDAPTASDNTVTTTEDNNHTFAASEFGFTDVDGDSLDHVTIATLPSTGTLYLSGVAVSAGDQISAANISNLVFTPAANGNGSPYDTFTFSVNDGTTDSASNYTMTVNVTAVNDAPTVVNDTDSVTEGGTVTETTNSAGTVISDDSDTDGDSLSVSGTVTQTSATDTSGSSITINSPNSASVGSAVTGYYGQLTLNSNGTYSYVANQSNADALDSGESATDVFTFTVSDGTTTTSSTITFTVNGANDAPTASDNTVTTTEDNNHTFAASEFGFTDVDGDSLDHVTIATLPSTGTLYLSGVAVSAGDQISAANISNLVFTPAANGNGSPYDTFTFSVNDGTTDSASNYTMTVNVTAVNDAPTASDNTVTTTEDNNHTFAASEFGFTDVDGDSLDHVTIATLPSTGTLYLSGVAVSAGDQISAANISNLVFTPAANGNGSPYDTFTFSVNDGTTDSASNYTMTVNVTAVNDAPTASDNTVTTTEDNNHTFAASEFGFTDVDGDSLDHVTIATLPSTGTLYLSGVAVSAGDQISAANISNLVFTPAANGNGSPYDTFTFSVNDGTTDSASNYTMTVNVTAVNDAPTVVNDTDSVTEGGTVTETTNSAGTVISDDSDTDGDSLSVSGTVTQTSATDTSGSSITINSPNSASVGSAVTGYYGQLTLNSNGTYSYVANQSNADALDSGESATDVFTFTVSDGTTTTSSTITFTVNGANDAPTASDNTVTTTEDNNHTFAASEFGFTDVDGDSLDHVTIATLPSTGTLYLSGVAVSAGDQISAANISNLVFTPAANGNGSPYDTFTFSVNDGTTDSASNYTMTVNVTAVNDAPTASDNTVTTTEDNNHTFAASEFGFTDVDGDSLDHVTIATLPSTGTLYLSGVAVSAGDQISAANISNLVFTPAANGNGSPYDTFTFSVNDGTTDSASNYTMTVNVTAVNDAPTASDNTVTTTEDNNHTFAASEFGFTDVDGDSLDHVTIATLPSTGTLYLSGVAVSAGDQISAANISNLVFTPAANGNGSPYDTFTFSVNDGTTDSASNYTMTVNVTAVNDAPTASDNTVTTTEDNNHTFAASEFGFTDVDGDSLDHVTIATLPSTGTLYLSGVAVSAGDQISAANISNLVFTPAANGNGSPYDTFTFSVNDGTTDSASNYTMTVNVTAVNDAPTVVNDTDSVTEGGTVTETTNSAGTVISDDSDTDGDSLSVSGTVTQTSATDTSGSSITINSPNSASVGSAVTGYYGQLTLNSNGTYSYVANQSNADALDSGESATDVFTFTVSDGTTTTSSTITFTVNGANDAPTASDNTVTTTEDNNHTFAASEFGFTDVDGDSLDHVTIATLPSTGTLYLSGVAVSAGDQISAANISNLVFTPAANGNGSPYDTFTFSVNDGTTDSASNYTMTVNVTAVNDAPTASDNTVTTTEDNNHTFAASEFGFTDVDGDSLDHVTIATLPSTGTLYLSGVAVSAGDQISAANISNLVFTPAANGNGSPYDTFTFSVNDGTTDSASNYTMTVNVTAVNDAPTASDNTVTTTEDNNHTFAASEFGFTDVDGDSLDHVTIATLPSTGTLYLSGVAVSAGDQISAANISNLVFTPAANGNGSPYDTFTFSVNDGTTDSASNYTMTVNVTAVNDAPTASDNTVTTTEDNNHTFAASEFGFTDVDGDSLDHVTIATLPSTGTLYLSGVAVSAGDQISAANISNLVFTPAANGNGSPYDTFTFSVNDGTTDSASNYTMTVNVTAVNDAPTASDNTVTTTEDNNHTFAASEFGFTDVDGDSLDHVTIATLPSTGTLYLSGVAVSAGDQISAANISNLVFTPAANGNGSPYDTFTFSVNDGTTDSASNYTMTVNVTAVNDAPTASDNTVTTTEDNNHTFAASEFGFTDVDGDSLDHVTIATLPSTGTLYLSGVAVSAGDQISAANISNLVFTPAANGNGSPYDTFTFSVNDGTTDSASNYTMTVNVTAVNDAPTVVNDTDSVTEGGTVTETTNSAGTVISDDSDTDGDSLSVSGTVTQTSATDTSGSSITINSPNSASVGSAVTGYYGQLTLNSNGTYSYVANQSNADALDSGESATDVFTFTVSDGTTTTSSTITFTVNGANDAPTASDNTVTTTEDNNHTFAASEFGFTDVDGDSLDHVTIATLPSTGTLYLSGVAVSAGDQISAANISNLVFTPAANGNGSPYDTFTFSVNDGTTDSASNYTMTVNVTAVNDAPTVVNDTDSVTEGGTVTETTNSAGTVISDDSDTDGDSLSVSGTVTQTSATDTSGSSITINSPNSASVGSAVTGYYGQLTLNSNGTYSYVANQSNADALDSGESATDVFTFTVSDGTTTTSSTITFTVNGANDAPTASDNTVTTTEDNNHTFAASEFGFTDVDGDSLDHVTIATLPSTGTLYLSGVAVSAGDQISAANISNLVFTPAANGNGSPYDTFTFSVNDGTTDSASNYTMTVNVTAVNDAPTASDNTVTTTEDNNHTFAASEFGFTDVDGDSLDHVTIATLPSTGTLYLSGVAVSAGDQISAANISNLVFTPAANGNGSPYDTFTFSVNDGTTDSASNYTMTVNVTAVNDAPTASDNTVTTTEDNNHTFAASEFGFTDVDGDSLDHVTIATLPSTGTLYLSGVAVSAGDQISAANISNLVFTPAANGNGSPYDTFTFSVNDGTTDSASNYTMTVNVTAVNDAPTASDNTVTTTEDNNHTFAASEFGFTDVDGDSLDHVTIATLPSTGTLYLSGVAVSAGDQISAANISNLVFTPAANGNGSPYDTFTFSVNDGTTDSASNYTMTVNVTAVNDAPTASDNTVTTTEDNNHTFAASEFGFTDVDGDSLDHVTIATLPSTGTLYLSGVAVSAGDQISAANISNLVFTPAANGNGSPYDTFTFSVNDGTTDSASNYTMTVNVTAVNDAPTASDNTVTTTEDNNHTFAASEFGFTDVDGDSLDHVTIATLPSTGTLYLSGVAVSAGDQISAANISNLVFTPAANGNGSPYDTFTFSVNDGTTDSASNYTMTVNVTAVNDAPTVVNDTDSVTEGGTVTETTNSAGTVISDDSDTDGDSLSVSGTVTQTSATDTSGSSITINSPNSASVGSAVTGYYGQLTLNSNGTYSYVANQSNADALDSGESATDVFTFTVSDGTTTTSSTITFTVNGANDAPTASDNTVTTTEDNNHTFAASEFGFTDVDGDSLDHVTIATLPSTGTLYLSGVAVSAGDQISAANISNLVFTPAANGNGSPYDTFTFSVNDGTTDSASNYTMTVNVTAVNDAPTASDNTVTTTEDNNHTFAASEFGFTDVDGDSLDHVTIATLPSTGTLYLSGVAVSAGDQISAANISNLVFTPAANGNGSPYDTFTFSVNDGTTDSASNYTMTVNVTAVNDAPVAVADTDSTNLGTNISVSNGATKDVLTDDTDVDGNTLEVSAILAGTSGPTTSVASGGSSTATGSYGTLTIYSNGAYTYVINNAAFSGASGGSTVNDIFTYTVTDGTDTDTTTLTISVTNKNDAPVATADTATSSEGSSTTVSNNASGLLSNDTDNDPGDTLVIRNISHTNGNTDSVSSNTTYQTGTTIIGTYGTLTIGSDGTYTYTPNDKLGANETGTDVFTYTVTDGTDNDTSTLTFTITGANDAPVASNDNNTIDISSTTSLTVPNGSSKDILVNDNDADTSATLSATEIRTGATGGSGTTGTIGQSLTGTYGSITVSSDGSYTYNVNSGLKDTLEKGKVVYDYFNYTVSDGTATDYATIIIKLQNGNKVNDLRDKKAERLIRKEIKKSKTVITEKGKIKVQSIFKGQENRIETLKTENKNSLSEGLKLVDLVAESNSLDVTDASLKSLKANEKVNSLNLKFKVFNETSNDVVKYEGIMIDGSKLPDWIEIDSKTGKTTAKIPDTVNNLEFIIIATDQNNEKREISVKIDPEQIKKDKEIFNNKISTKVNDNGNVNIIKKNDDGSIDKTSSKVLNFNNNSDIKNIIENTESDFKYQLKSFNLGNNLVISLPKEFLGIFDRTKIVLPDGSEAPEWIKYNPITGEISATPPEGIFKLDLKLIIDNEGKIIVRDLEIEFNQDNIDDDSNEEDSNKFIGFKDQLNKEFANWEDYGSQIINRL